MEFHEIKQPKDIPVKEREDAMGAYLMMFASLAAGLPLPIINLISSIIYFQVNKKKGHFVYFHSYQSLISQVPLTIMNMICFSWGLFYKGWEDPIWWGYFTAVIIGNVLYFIFSLIGCVRARKGRMFYFLFFGRIAYSRAYRVKPEESEEEINLPPRL